MLIINIVSIVIIFIHLMIYQFFDNLITINNVNTIEKRILLFSLVKMELY